MKLRTAFYLALASSALLFISACGPAPAVSVGGVKVTAPQAKAYLASHHGKGSEAERLEALAARERVVLASGITGADAALRDKIAGSEASLLTEAYLEAKFPGQMEVTPEKLREVYDGLAEQRHLRHILVATEEEAKGVAAKLKAGGDFATLAQKLSKDEGSAKKGGELGWVGKQGLDAKFAEAAFAQAEGTISEPVKSQFGYHLIEVLGVKKPSDEEFARDRQAIAQRARRDLGTQLQQMALHALEMMVKVTTVDGPIDADENDLNERPGDGAAVVATVGETEKITLADLKAYMRRFFKGEQMSHSLGGQVKKQFLGQLTKERIILAAAKKENLDKDEAFRAKVWDATQDLLESEARSRYLQGYAPTDDELKGYYEAHKADFSANPEARLRLLAGNDPSLLNSLAGALKGSPESFEEAVRKHSIDEETAANGGDIGWVGQMALENLVGAGVAAEVLKAEAGSVMGPYATPFGGILLKVDERRAGEPMAFEQIKERLVGDYKRLEQAKILAAWDAELAAKWPAKVNVAALAEAKK